MAIDKKTGKRKPIGKAAKELEKSKRKVPKYEIDYEEGKITDELVSYSYFNTEKEEE